MVVDPPPSEYDMQSCKNSKHAMTRMVAHVACTITACIKCDNLVMISNESSFQYEYIGKRADFEQLYLNLNIPILYQFEYPRLLNQSFFDKYPKINRIWP